MQKEWVLEYQDYVAAQKLFIRGSIGRRLWMMVLLWVLPGFVLLMLAILIAGVFMNHGQNFERGLGNMAGLFVAVLVIRFSYWRNLRRSYKRMFLNGDPTKPVYMSIDDERVVSGIPGSSEGKFYWPTILKFDEDERIAILYVSKRLFLMIPKNKLAPEDWGEMKAIISSHVSGAV